MKKVTLASMITCLFILSTSCNKETEVTSSPALQASSAGLSQASGSHFIGEHFGGGIIFYLDGSGKHGLIASSQDLQDGKQMLGGVPEASVWSRKDTLNDAKDTALGAGAGNTRRIVKTQGFPQYEADSYAALACVGLIQNGYQDWYLPSKNELNELYKQKDVVGGFSPFSYWSSSEKNATKAWMKNFNNGSNILQVKIAANALRPIRKF